MGYLPHEVTLIRQRQAGEAVGGWATWQTTGRACMVCNCGTATGWIEDAEATAIAAQHLGWSPVSEGGCTLALPPQQPEYKGITVEISEKLDRGTIERLMKGMKAKA